MARFRNNELDTSAFGGAFTRDDATRAVENALLFLKNRRGTEDQLATLADALVAYCERAWPVAAALSFRVLRQRTDLHIGQGPVDLARAWNDIEARFLEARTRLARIAATPIVNPRFEILAWTFVPPQVDAHAISHRVAEGVVGGPVVSRQVTLFEERDIAKAGAPDGWQAPWTCYALCSAGIVAHLKVYDVPKVKSRPDMLAPIIDHAECRRSRGRAARPRR